MSTRFKVSNLKAGQLDNKCLTILAKLTRVLAEHDIVLKLKDEGILKKVDFYARHSDSKEVSILHAQLKVALKSYIASPSFIEKLPMILYREKRQIEDRKTNS